jgi:hypothetical protein
MFPSDILFERIFNLIKETKVKPQTIETNVKRYEVSRSKMLSEVSCGSVVFALFRPYGRGSLFLYSSLSYSKSTYGRPLLLVLDL